MDFFDSLINETFCSVKNCNSKKYSFDPQNLWNEEDFSHVILQRDTYCELDGTGFNLVTSSPAEDGIFVIGEELSELRGKRKFVRVCVVEIEDDSDEQKNYNLIRKIDYIKYHFFPEGYMLRTSSRAHKESVRVASSAIKKGISFEKIGNLLIKKYKENPAVIGVTVFFISDENADFAKFEVLAQKSNSISETLNHVMNSVKFDCDTCNLKAVCDEIEGMKELHFKQGMIK